MPAREHVRQRLGAWSFRLPVGIVDAFGPRRTGRSGLATRSRPAWQGQTPARTQAVGQTPARAPLGYSDFFRIMPAGARRARATARRFGSGLPSRLLLARHGLAHHVRAQEAHRIGREAALTAVDEAQALHSSALPRASDERMRPPTTAGRRRCPRSPRRRRCGCGRPGGRRSAGPCACGRSGRTSPSRSARRRASGRSRGGSARPARARPSSRSKRGPMRSASAIPQPPLPKTMRPSSVVR